MVFGKGSFYELSEAVEFCNYPSLEKIVFKNISFSHINSFRISDNEKLKEIIIEDGENFTRKGISCFEGAFGVVGDVIFESIKCKI